MSQKRSSSSTRTLQNNIELGPGICPKSPKHTRIIEILDEIYARAQT
jgi:hypothetical protein